MGVDKGAAVWHSPHQYFRLVRHAAPKKSDDLKYENVIKKRDEIRANKHHRMHEISPFQKKKIRSPSPPSKHSLAPSELNFAAPIEMIWLRL